MCLKHYRTGKRRTYLNGAPILGEALIRKIRKTVNVEDLKDVRKCAKLMLKYNMHPHRIKDIVTGRSYDWVK